MIRFLWKRYLKRKAAKLAKKKKKKAAGSSTSKGKSKKKGKKGKKDDGPEKTEVIKIGPTEVITKYEEQQEMYIQSW